MKKRIFFPALTCMLVSFYSCGGGGGGSVKASPTSSKVVSKVEASIVKGATVCINGTNICNQTDENGIASLPVSSLPTTLSVNVGNVTIGFVNATAPYVPITPITLADNDNKTAQKLGAFLHALDGDTDGNATVIDLSNVTVELSDKEKKPLVELLKKKSATLKISVKHKDKGNHTITINNQTVSYDGKKVEYNIKLIEEKHKKEEIAKQFLHFVFEAWKENYKVLFLNSQEENIDTCNIRLNPENPLEFKFENCLNDIAPPDWLSLDNKELDQIINVKTGEPVFNLIKVGEDKIELKNLQENEILYLEIQYHNEEHEIEEDGEHGKEKPKDYSKVISGIIEADWIPENLKIRITPDVEQVEGDWGGIVCEVEEDGSFGKECVLHGNIENYNHDHIYQIIIFKDLNEDWRFDKSEESTVIWSINNATYNSWKIIDLHGYIIEEEE